MRWPILISAALLAAGCSQAGDPAVERMKQQVLMTLREHDTAEFADIRRCDGETAMRAPSPPATEMAVGAGRCVSS